MDGSVIHRGREVQEERAVGGFLKESQGKRIMSLVLNMLKLRYLWKNWQKIRDSWVHRSGNWSLVERHKSMSHLQIHGNSSNESEWACLGREYQAKTGEDLGLSLWNSNIFWLGRTWLCGKEIGNNVVPCNDSLEKNFQVRSDQIATIYWVVHGTMTLQR